MKAGHQLRRGKGLWKGGGCTPLASLQGRGQPGTHDQGKMKQSGGGQGSRVASCLGTGTCLEPTPSTAGPASGTPLSPLQIWMFGRLRGREGIARGWGREGTSQEPVCEMLSDVAHPPE